MHHLRHIESSARKECGPTLAIGGGGEGTTGGGSGEGTTGGVGGEGTTGGVGGESTTGGGDGTGGGEEPAGGGGGAGGGGDGGIGVPQNCKRVRNVGNELETGAKTSDRRCR
jgi:hypothetical protein